MKKIILKKKPLVCLTAYNKFMAELIDPFCDLILIGDTMAMVYYGYSNTRSLSLSTVIKHSKSVREGIKKSAMVVDMPFGTYSNPKQALKNAKKIIQETKCDAIKLEGGSEIASTVSILIKNKIQVVGHIGLLPQQIKTSSGFTVKGKTNEEEEKIVKDFVTLQKIGVAAIVLEAVKEKVANRLSKLSKIPLIGIGASKHCSGQILVTEDMLGLFEKSPKFVKKYFNLRKAIQKSVEKYSKEVQSRKFPSKKNVY